jgi:K+-transporting ATPase KdpF subunit
MSTVEWLAVAVTVGLFAYLVYAMFFPERFA